MTEFRNFHAGEAKLQAESGVDTAEFDAGVDQPFLPELNSSEVKFVEGRTFSVAASLDASGRPWASPLVAPAGELFTVEDLTTIRIRPRRIDGDPLFDNVDQTESMGVLYFNPAIRRRAKSLGAGTVEDDGSITYRMTRMFGICPKYIFKRTHEPEGATAPDNTATPQSSPSLSSSLSTDDQAQLAASDTVFLASHSAQHGTDPTHRGGPPGFVTVRNDTTVSIPDYVGNGMFQTLGNLLLDDRIGLTAIDYQTGRILQLTGRGSIQTADGDLTNRTLVVSIDQVRSTHGDIGSWTDVEPFEFA